MVKLFTLQTGVFIIHHYKKYRFAISSGYFVLLQITGSE